MKLVEQEMKPRIYLSSSDRILIDKSPSIAGMLKKWKVGDKIIKADFCGYQGLAEKLVSWFLGFTDISERTYVKYNVCEIWEDGIKIGNGCWCIDFLKGDTELSFKQILESRAIPLSADYETVRDVVYDVTGIDPKDYMDTVLYIDAITRNTDRHFGNLCAVEHKDGAYSYAPIFDNGAACLSDLINFPIDEDFNTCIKRAYAKPFKLDFLEQIEFNRIINIRYDDFVKSVEVTSDYGKRAMQTILYGLERSEGVVWSRV